MLHLRITQCIINPSFRPTICFSLLQTRRNILRKHINLFLTFGSDPISHRQHNQHHQTNRNFKPLSPFDHYHF
ncbi:hypothetical protein [uncultured Neisseria sp.]|uniref:hypothetical protein n=1 Tax=uncultured Neisseria sp. TaxID=237778 RepID=UPI0025CFF47B|nr:hypothetical protein [uncultured Neisseria sp.]